MFWNAPGRGQKDPIAPKTPAQGGGFIYRKLVESESDVEDPS